MAAPTITINYNDATEAAPNWVAVGATSSINFTGPDSVDGTMDPITRPAVGVRVADELWIVTTGTDVNVGARYTGGGQEVADFVTDVFTANPTDTNVMGIIATVNPETSPGILRAWDDNNYNTTAIESLTGTTNHIESFWRACETGSNVTTASGAGSIPGAYLTQTANTTTYCLEGDTNELVFSTALSTGNMNRFLFHLLIPDDATNPAAAARTISLTYHFFYT